METCRSRNGFCPKFALVFFVEVRAKHHSVGAVTESHELALYHAVELWAVWGSEFKLNTVFVTEVLNTLDVLACVITAQILRCDFGALE